MILTIASLLSLPVAGFGFLVEWRAWDRLLFGDPPGDTGSWLRAGGYAVVALLVRRGAEGVYALLVPRDPTLVIGRGVTAMLCVFGLGFVFYAGREVGRLVRGE